MSSQLLKQLSDPLNAIDLDLGALTTQLKLLNETLLRFEAGAPYLLGVLALIAAGIWFRK